MTQQTSADLSSAQSQLASLTPPSKPGGDDEKAQSSYQSQLNAYNQQKRGLEQKISQLQRQLQQLQTESRRLQNEKVRLNREKDSKQREVSQLETNVQALQQVIDGIQQTRADENYKLNNKLENDSLLKNLQSKFDELDGKVSAKEAELSQLEGRIAEAEAKNSGLQAAREDDADRKFQESAKDMGFKVADAEAEAQNKAAKDCYGKKYSELTEEEQLAIEARVDGEVTLAAMNQAKEILKRDPDNVAAQMVLERGAKNLDAQERMTRADLYSSLDNMPADMQEGAAKVMDEARRNAPEGTDPEIAALNALSDYVTKSVDERDYSTEELAALEDIMGSAGNYIDARECAFQGADVLDKAAVSLEKSDMYAMRVRLAAEQGVDPDQITVLSGTSDSDFIQILDDQNGGLCVTINGEEHHYTAEEARLLLIGGGKGNDTIVADYLVTQDLHIYGGAGDDRIFGGGGNDLIGGGDGDDEIYGYDGNDTIFGGKGNDVIDGGWGDDYVFGGEGKDTINGGYGNDILDGGAGKDKIYGHGGHDIISGGDGDDYINGGDGDDFLLGEAGNDTIEGRDGDDTISGGIGADTIKGGDGSDTISGGAGADDIDGG